MAEERDVPEVRPPTLDDVRRICRALHDAGARYLLIGGFAVILHGGGRTTKDIDLLVDPSPDNVERLKSALSVDLLASACGVTWAEAQATARQIDLDGTPVLFADRRTLARTKQTIRPSDAADRAWLDALPDDVDD